MSHRDLTKFVYAIYSPAAKQFKIGVSVAPSIRLHAMQWAHGSLLKLITLYPEPKGYNEFDEKAIHRRLAGHRLLGEWFTNSPAVLAVVEEMKAEQAKHEAGILPTPLCYACRLPVPRITAVAS
jgi:Meiotically up-regulated gene 113